MAAPRKHGFGLLAWWVPIGGIIVAAAVVGLAAWRWSRRRADEAVVDATTNGRGTADPLLDRRVDEELARYDG